MEFDGVHDMAELEIEALTFDVFGTVVDWRNGIAKEAETILAAEGHHVDGQAFALAWRARYQPSMEEVRARRRPFVRLDVLHRENLLDVFREFEIDGVSDDTTDRLNRAWHRLPAWPDVTKGLARLKRRFIIAPLSNGNVSLMVNLAKHEGLGWDVILGAEIAEAYKPEPEAYMRAAALLDLHPSRCLMVAAHNSDLVAAATTGMKTAFVPRIDEYGAHQKADFAAEHDFDIIADDFEDLAHKLGV